MDRRAFRAAAHAVVDLMADYLEHVETAPVFPADRARLAAPAVPGRAAGGARADRRDPRRLRAPVEPNATHWQHPGFLAYFATTASGPGILGEMLTAALGQNPMLWRTSPIGTELEEVVVDWLRQALGLPAAFDGLLTDTASTSSLIALAAAREAAGLDVAARGLAGRPDVPALRVYASSEAHSSIEKACMTLGPRPGVARPHPGRRAVRDASRTRSTPRSPPTAPPGAGRSRSWRRSGRPRRPRSTRSRAIADIAEREGSGSTSTRPTPGSWRCSPSGARRSHGWERADSIVVNPHKWLFTPLDASLLLTRRMADLRAAFSLVPEYLRTLDRETPVRDYNEYKPQLGRRFRALKLWIQLRWFGLEGLRRRIERHLEMAAGVRRLGRRGSGLGAAGAGAVLDGLLPLEPGGRDRRDDGARRRATPRSWTRSTAPARSSCRTPGSPAGSRSGSRSATCGRSARHVERAWALLREAARAR